MFNEIEKEIERMMIDYPEHIGLINTLNEQRIMVYNCSWEDGETEDFLKGDYDILNDIKHDSSFYEDVRNVQDMLVNSQIIIIDEV